MHTSSLTSALGALVALPLLAQAAPNHLLGRSAPPLATSFPTPTEDPFYDIPKNISSYANGDVIRARSVHSTEFGTTVEARQLFYRTTNRMGDATGTVTTVFIPANPASPPEILSYQSPEDALAIRCAPSWANVNTSSPQESYLVEQLTPVAEVGLRAGQYVINSDDEDENSSWLVGITEGRATLDGIRATINNLALSKKTKIGLLGYSGGAHETVWASSLAAAYAPELDIVGAAYGGTPVDLASNFDLLNGGPEAALAGGAIAGIAKGYPKFRRTLNHLMTKKGKQVFKQLRGVDACIVENGTAFAGFNFSSTEYFKGGNPMNNPTIAHIISEGSLLMNVTPLAVPVPKFARYEWHGTNDTTVPYAPEVEYIHQQCAHGANIVFRPYPGLNHDEAFVAGIPDALVFLEDAFAGALTKPKCGANATLPGE